MKKYHYNVLHGTKTEIHRKTLRQHAHTIGEEYGSTIAVILFFVVMGTLAIFLA